MTFHTDTIEDIRDRFRLLKERGDHVKHPEGMLEVMGASFWADEATIFGEPNDDYICREIAWYDTGIPNINQMEGPVPEIWKKVANESGEVNSQYGYLIHYEDQYDHVVSELMNKPHGRRGTIVYTRPSIHIDATLDGMDDFICTNAVSYFIRNGFLMAVVQMRSNDVVFGYRNDYAWQRTVLERMAADLDVPPGPILWQAASLHVYPRHIDLVV